MGHHSITREGRVFNCSQQNVDVIFSDFFLFTKLYPKLRPNIDLEVEEPS